ncbi:hypothetical protein JOC70_000375 [Clostridium pascui]|uniref:hypothetical protein n=1 Tax=Clostridium pascui TaxID=46609 RepID=UPI00195E2B41|nr:hypothetical protein [Clostridium pascui]MBM7868906.1 hypothetical protein [Clostridium pascui]
MSESIIVLLSILPSFSPSYSIGLVKCSMNSKRDEYYLIHTKPAINFSDIDEEEFFNEARKIHLSNNDASDIIKIIRESRVPLISQSSIGVDGCEYSLYFFDDDGSAKSRFSWWGNIPNDWYDLDRIATALNKHLHKG